MLQCIRLTDFDVRLMNFDISKCNSRLLILATLHTIIFVPCTCIYKHYRFDLQIQLLLYMNCDLASYAYVDQEAQVKHVANPTLSYACML